MRIGIVGAGNNADYHVRFSRLYPGAEIVGIADTNLARAEEVARAYGIPRAFGSTAELLREAQPAVVHVVTPPMTHFAVVREVLQAGCHALVEKPLALNADEAHALYELAERHRVQLCPVVDGATEVSEMLREAGHRVFELRNCVAALLEIARLRPELIVVNVRAHGENGFKLCRDIKNEIPAPSILAITGLANPDDRQRGAEAGADAFIACPFDRQQLQLRVAELLGPEPIPKRAAAHEATTADSEVAHESSHSRGRR